LSKYRLPSKRFFAEKSFLLNCVILAGFAVACMFLAWKTVRLAEASEPGGSQAAAGAKFDGKTVVFGMNWEPVGFYPLRAVDSASYYGQTLVYEGLVSYGAESEIVPGLAERFEVSPDGLTYRFWLRKNLRFSDGMPVTMQDVSESIKAASSKVSPYKDDYRDIKEVSTDGDKVVLQLHRPCAPLLSRLVELKVLPASLLCTIDKGKSVLMRHPVSSGPFRLVRWESGLELVFEPNPYYWGKQPDVKRLVWRVIPDMSLLSMSLSRGDVHVAQVDARAWKYFLSRKPNLALDAFAGSRTIYLGFNVSRSPFDEDAVRQAIAHCVDRRIILSKLYGDFGVLPTSDSAEGRWSFDKTVRTYEFNPEKGRQLLEKQGFKLDTQGYVREKDGKHQLLAFRIKSTKDSCYIAEAIAGQLRESHIPCEVEVVEFAALRHRYLAKGDYDVTLWSRSSGPDPDCYLIWSSKGPMNFSRYYDPMVDELIQQGRIATSINERKKVYSQMQSILAKRVPWVFVVQPRLMIAHQKWITNVSCGTQRATGVPWDNPLFNAARWSFTSQRN
jgi:peptide/nickel transport system substrate-binding protein